MKRLKLFALSTVLTFTMMAGVLPAHAIDDNKLVVDIIGDRPGTVEYTVGFAEKGYDALSDNGKHSYSGTLVFDPTKDYNDKADVTDKFPAYSIDLYKMGLMQGQAATITFTVKATVTDAIKDTVVLTKGSSDISVVGALPTQTVTISNTKEDGLSTYLVEFNAPGSISLIGSLTEIGEEGVALGGGIITPTPYLSYRVIGTGKGSINGESRFNSQVDQEKKTKKNKSKNVDVYDIELVAAAGENSKFVGWFSDYEGKVFITDKTTYKDRLTDKDVTLYAKFDLIEKIGNGAIAQSGNIKLPKTGGVPMMMITGAGVGLVSLGFLFRRKKKPTDID